ncbi:DUF2807 domain-containing protein [Hyphococcus flavus]|uniref:DUF2807 domain-containing protein n=1 Tax=Hyphococcus flavus TaxID=1866326 RepID=A0AAE9ZH37_9PROT|nr:DUF2807 domain-containing protein [Hyphococcus flavus]WDI32928.1 DUF2807 domain-containing protein [Hyphococcus flavus]
MPIQQFMTAAFGAAAIFASAAHAEVSTHQNINTVEIRDFIGAVNIETAASGDVRLDNQPGDDADYPVIVDTDNGVLSIRSYEDPDETRWHRDVDWRRYEERAFEVFLEDYPTITLTIPAGAALSFDSAVVKLTADNTNGALSVREGHVDGVIGDIASGDIKIHGSGDLKTGVVAGALDIGIHGSGDFEALTVETLEASIHGSGDINLRDVNGDATVGIHGSGDVTLGNVNGSFVASIHGSGDIDAGDVAGGAATSVYGSGDISLASINGETTAKVHGSGYINIRDGRAEDLRVEIHGSGGFDFGGVATNPDVRASRSGDVYIRRHEGSVRVSGDGDVRISGVQYGDD